MKIWTKRILLFLICMGVAGCLAVVWLSAYVKSETAARILSAEEAAKQDADWKQALRFIGQAWRKSF